MEKDKLIEKIQDTIDAENTMSFCFSHLAGLVKNGRIRKQFYSLSGSAKANKDSLMRILEREEVKDFSLENRCKFCKIKTESFSLIGAINLGLEVTGAAIKFYKDLLELSSNLEDKRLFGKLLKEKTGQSNFLKKEKRFEREDRDKTNFIDYYCMPEVISKIWK